MTATRQESCQNPHVSEPKPWHVVKMITYIIYINKQQNNKSQKNNKPQKNTYRLSPEIRHMAAQAAAQHNHFCRDTGEGGRMQAKQAGFN